MEWFNHKLTELIGTALVFSITKDSLMETELTVNISIVAIWERMTIEFEELIARLLDDSVCP
jgi:hypothetical protein